MLVLSLDSSSIASAALTRNGEVLAEFATQDTRSHAEALAPAVYNLLGQVDLEPSQLTSILVGTGPGPFTGLRAGLVSARTFGFVWNLPVHGMCSLDALAHRAAQSTVDGTEFLVATDARRKELYWGRYVTHEDGHGRFAVSLNGPQVTAPEELPKLPIYGYGAGLYSDHLPYAVADSTDWQPTAADLSRAAWALQERGTELSTDTSPLYLRESDAKVPVQRKKALR
ncbi:MULTISPECIES: tRNA (adenosine(37)-N6)-threonylcarbamoyltransferase complex dimerization subunit type 1 TsaB [Kocuria]|uniref:tRNA (Adenosine(37)-N6)-threonylcarbamoyltransferase complex dimerization subunit type 1 TsaB n=1 Tax=Kocuria atrinae TaxID=592377 RepID=A0ABN2XE50_9MICC|nr:tRNA (adenosine(37)-N6)-threonylcarbamoyltransferase complex dimerization subunit type 1 TsaB [Kocuria carniphila]MCT1802376.1 tRNA (adenosine(37)-N6)-threonylcarbamoyltransferase complex dimerization subunit type 1 TsaB [Kocuria carniphila]